jgi:hypothetical protein
MAIDTDYHEGDAVSFDHIGELPEVRLYLDSGKHNFMLHGGFGIRYIRESNADAALAAADREVGRLKCCGNYFYSSSAICCEPQLLETDGDNYVETHGGRNPCHFTPSRWTRRETP